MPAVDLKMLGDKELDRMLDQLPAAAQKKAVRPALRKSATRIKRKMMAKLNGFPVGVVTGKLRDSFKRAVESVGGRTSIAYAVPLPEDKETAIQAQALEYGWRDRSGKKQPARSYMRTAIDENAETEKRIIAREIGEGVEKQAKRLATK